MTTNAASVATAIRDELRNRIAYLPDRKLHALLYLAQGVYFAANDKPLFSDDIAVTDQGVHLDLKTDAGGQLDDGQAAVALLIVSRYGGLSAMDLEALIRGQGPWSYARKAGERLIDQEAVRGFFRAQDEIPEGTLTGFPRSVRASVHPQAGDPRRLAERDDPAEIAAFAAEMRSKM